MFTSLNEPPFEVDSMLVSGLLSRLLAEKSAGGAGGDPNGDTAGDADGEHDLATCPLVDEDQDLIEFDDIDSQSAPVTCRSTAAAKFFSVAATALGTGSSLEASWWVAFPPADESNCFCDHVLASHLTLPSRTVLASLEYVEEPSSDMAELG